MVDIKDSKPVEANSDVQFQNLGSLWDFQLLTDRAIQWAAENVADDEGRVYPNRITADWRMGRDILEAMKADGLSIMVAS